MARRRNLRWLGLAGLSVFSLIAFLRSMKFGGGADVELTLAYIVNLIVLAPVGLVTLFSSNAAASIFEGRFGRSHGLQVLVGCLWTGILICSIIGLLYPKEMLGILVLQVAYKALFLITFAIPRILSGRLKEVPRAMSAIFLGIIVFWPVIIWRGLT